MSEERIVPERKHVVRINVQADDLGELLRTIDQIKYDLDTHNGEGHVISGGWGAGYEITAKVNPDQTHDHYFEEVQRFLEAEEKGEEA